MHLFGRHHDHRGRDQEGRSRGGRHEGFGRFKGGRGRERLFEHGDLKLVVLNLLEANPSHGYEIIKAIGELAGGDYSPSPGVIYPTLTLLEDIGHVKMTREQDGKKQYGITPEGRLHLEGQRDTLQRILARLTSAGSAADARRAPELQRSMENLKMALHFRLSRGALEAEALRKIAEALDRAAVDVERS